MAKDVSKAGRVYVLIFKHAEAWVPQRRLSSFVSTIPVACGEKLS